MRETVLSAVRVSAIARMYVSRRRQDQVRHRRVMAVQEYRCIQCVLTHLQVDRECACHRFCAVSVVSTHVWKSEVEHELAPMDELTGAAKYSLNATNPLHGQKRASFTVTSALEDSLPLGGSSHSRFEWWYICGQTWVCGRQHACGLA